MERDECLGRLGCMTAATERAVKQYLMSASERIDVPDNGNGLESVRRRAAELKSLRRRSWFGRMRLRLDRHMWSLD